MLQLPHKNYSEVSMFEKLQNAMQEVESLSNHNGYLYRVSDVLIIMICGLMSSLQTIKEIHMWCNTPYAKKFFKEEFEITHIPKKAHFYNILTYVNFKKFNEEFSKWIIDTLQQGLEGETIAIDGKSIRSTAKLRKSSSALHIASAMIATTGIVIASKECDYSKEHEINAFRSMLQEINLKNAIVVADALHCQKKSAEEVIKAGADYLFVVKDNQKNLKENVDLLSYNKTTDKACTLEKNAGRIEKRTAYVSHLLDDFSGKTEWANLTCVGRIEREFEKDGNVSKQTHYYISSRRLSAQELLKHARLEWKIESMHWQLDVHFEEDKTKVRNMEVQKTLNLMRKIVINILKQYQASLPKHIPMSNILLQNFLDITQLSRIIAQFKQYPKLD